MFQVRSADNLFYSPEALEFTFSFFFFFIVVRRRVKVNGIDPSNPFVSVGIFESEFQRDCLRARNQSAIVKFNFFWRKRTTRPIDYLFFCFRAQFQRETSSQFVATFTLNNHSGEIARDYVFTTRIVRLARFCRARLLGPSCVIGKTVPINGERIETRKSFDEFYGARAPERCFTVPPAVQSPSKCRRISNRIVINRPLLSVRTTTKPFCFCFESPRRAPLPSYFAEQTATNPAPTTGTF